MAAGVSNLHGETSYRYRKFKSDAMMAITVGATILTLIPLFLVLGYLLTKGVASLNSAFFTAHARAGRRRGRRHGQRDRRHARSRRHRMPDRSADRRRRGTLPGGKSREPVHQLGAVSRRTC